MDSASPAQQRPALHGWLYMRGGAVSVSQTHRIFKFSILFYYYFLVWDVSQNVAIYIIRSDEADGGVRVT